MAIGIAIMVQGCTSDAGKSLITMALCRHLSNLGLKVAPFKAQNMSNNARVVAGGEIGTAQWLQAKAARVNPDVRMNPVLLKPESDVKSQVIVLGKANLEYSQMDWRFRSNLLWDVVSNSLHELLEEFEIVVIEGAGYRKYACSRISQCKSLIGRRYRSGWCLCTFIWHVFAPARKASKINSWLFTQ
jgi:adenosylcobyric acid synthase